MENDHDPQLDLPAPDTPAEVSPPPRTRRSFLGTLAAAAAALTAAVFGFSPKLAQAYDIACCHLCLAPSGSGCSNVNGTWAWSCCLPQNGTRYSCVEYYKTSPNWDKWEMTGDCRYVYGCSTYFRIGTC
jgi:hypothetical protein